MNGITIAEDVRLDLGHTDLVGNLVFDGEGLTLVTPSGTNQLLGHMLFIVKPGEVIQAPEFSILIEELGTLRTLPAALVALGGFSEVARHTGVSTWGVDVVELSVDVPEHAAILRSAAPLAAAA